ncbi:MAG: hypothetical protein PHP80_02775, partial [Synergistaceae bacterium]|nr:hypothetical protein [Synergistaceae bacterium]
FFLNLREPVRKGKRNRSQGCRCVAIMLQATIFQMKCQGVDACHVPVSGANGMVFPAAINLCLYDTILWFIVAPEQFV